jgi:hypothetical protein
MKMVALFVVSWLKMFHWGLFYFRGHKTSAGAPSSELDDGGSFPPWLDSPGSTRCHGAMTKWVVVQKVPAAFLRKCGLTGYPPQIALPSSFTVYWGFFPPSWFMDHDLSKAVLHNHLILHICKQNILASLLILFLTLYSDVLFLNGIEITKESFPVTDVVEVSDGCGRRRPSTLYCWSVRLCEKLCPDLAVCHVFVKNLHRILYRF